MKRTTLLLALGLLATTAAAEPAALTPFDLAAGAIALPPHAGLPTGPQRAKLVWMSTTGGAVETDEACRLGVEADRIVQLPGRQCPKLWRNTQPRTVVVSIDGKALPLKWSVIDSRGLIGPELQLPEGPSAWAGYDRYTSGWVTWTGPVPPGVASALRSGEGSFVYGQRESGVEAWKVAGGSMPTAILVPTPSTQPPPPVAPAPAPVAPAPAPAAAAPLPRAQDAAPTPIPRAPRPTREPAPRPVRTSSDGAYRVGALRVGAVAMFGDAVDQHFSSYTAPQSGQAELALSSAPPADLDLFVGYAPYLSPRGDRCDRWTRCLAPILGLGVPTHGGGTSLVTSLHAGAELEWTRGFATGLTATARQVTRLAEGAALGQPVGDGALPVIEHLGLGLGLTITATPRWGER